MGRRRETLSSRRREEFVLSRGNTVGAGGIAMESRLMRAFWITGDAIETEETGKTRFGDISLLCVRLSSTRRFLFDEYSVDFCSLVRLSLVSPSLSAVRLAARAYACEIRFRRGIRASILVGRCVARRPENACTRILVRECM